MVYAFFEFHQALTPGERRSESEKPKSRNFHLQRSDVFFGKSWRKYIFQRSNGLFDEVLMIRMLQGSTGEKVEEVTFSFSGKTLKLRLSGGRTVKISTSAAIDFFPYKDKLIASRLLMREEVTDPEIISRLQEEPTLIFLQREAFLKAFPQYGVKIEGLWHEGCYVSFDVFSQGDQPR